MKLTNQTACRLQPNRLGASRRAGFTLVEMLTVIVILALLLGLLGGAGLRRKI